MKYEHGIIIALLLLLIFFQVKSKYGLERPAESSVGGKSASLGFYKKSSPTA